MALLQHVWVKEDTVEKFVDLRGFVKLLLG